MAIYAIGDVQGCVTPLQKMLDTLSFDPSQDRLWLSGDLVNRGPHSLETLRLIKGLGDSAVAVLGNHDLHLLAVAAGIKKCRSGDTLQDILDAPDRDELIEWLRRRPLVHCDDQAESGEKTLMLHAGIYPGWDEKEVLEHAGEIETILRGATYRQCLEDMYGHEKVHWDGHISVQQRLQFIINAFTRMRYCTLDGDLDFTHSGTPGSQPHGLVPWFDHPNLKCKRWRIVFGHWSSLGFMQRDNLLGLDSGCGWGGMLTAVRLDGDDAGKSWQVQCGHHA